MSSSTTSTPGSIAQSSTPGITPTGNRVGGSGSPSMGEPQTTPMPPILFSDIEPVHFVRLYPAEAAKGDAPAAALAAGEATAAAGETLVAAQQADQVQSTSQPAPPVNTGTVASSDTSF